MILDDIKSFITQNGIINTDCIKYDYDCLHGEDVCILNLYDNSPSDLALCSGIKLIAKFKDLNTARQTSFALYNLFFPKDNFQKAITINGKIMHAKLNKGPCFLEKDQSKRYIYLLDITVIHNR